jgi:hypothetical protein
VDQNQSNTPSAAENTGSHTEVDHSQEHFFISGNLKIQVVSQRWIRNIPKAAVSFSFFHGAAQLGCGVAQWFESRP